jgi:peptidoglycan/LPS O-acetylase OafA/YrhL
VVEVAFYLSLPLLVLLAIRLSRLARTRTGRVWACLAPGVLLLVVGVVSRQLGRSFFFDPSDPSGYANSWFAVWERSLLSQADLLSFGMMLAVLKVEIDDRRMSLFRGWQGAWFAAAAAIGVPAVLWASRGGPNYHRYLTIMAVVTALLVAMVALVPRDHAAGNPLIRLLEWPPIRYTGLISYSIFLWHYPIVYWLRINDVTIDGRGGYFVNLVIVAAITWILASITYRFVEAPFMRRKGHRRAPVSAPDTPLQTGTQAQAAP